MFFNLMCAKYGPCFRSARFNDPFQAKRTNTNEQPARKTHPPKNRSDHTARSHRFRALSVEKSTQRQTSGGGSASFWTDGTAEAVVSEDSTEIKGLNTSVSQTHRCVCVCFSSRRSGKFKGRPKGQLGLDFDTYPPPVWENMRFTPTIGHTLSPSYQRTTTPFT